MIRKSDLLALPALPATPEMMQSAKDNHPTETKRAYYFGHAETALVFKYPLYMRSHISGDILKVSFYSAEAMRLGAEQPIYDVYISKTLDRFLTYSYADEKWRNAKLDRLDWPRAVHQGGTRWITEEDERSIKEYFNSNRNSKRSAYITILDYQESVREKELRARHKKETDAWDEELKQIRPLPKDWERWVDKIAIPEQFVYYEYRRGGATTGYCSYCKKNVPIKEPRHNKDGRCPCCRRQIVFKSVGRTGFLMTDRYPAYLLQKVECGFIIRTFEVWRRQCKGEHKSPKTNYQEVRRAFFTADGHAISAYYWGVYKQADLRWCKGSRCGGYYGFGIPEGRVYGKTLPQLARDGLNRTGLMEYMRRKKKLNPEFYLAVFNDVPQIEQLSKAGLPTLVDECLRQSHYFKKLFAAEKETSLTGILGINGQELKRLRYCNGDSRFLKWLRLERATGHPIPDETIKWFCKESLDPDDVKFIFDRMQPAQIQHYLCRQMKLCQMNMQQTLTTWKDYLNMAAGFHYDVNDAIVYRTPKLRQRHDELVERSICKERAVRAGEILTKFPHIDDICATLTDKYAYTGDQYQVLAPHSVLDILIEGDTLHHCIASSDRYFERIERNESYLLFLRKAEDAQTPYYTMEIEPNGTVRQIRTKYDRQNADIEEARSFLREWQKTIAGRLTKTDQKMAEQSRSLREQEFVQMRKDQIRIHTGDLAGRLLVDVLTADLMEAA